MVIQNSQPTPEPDEQKSFFQVIVHSFFIIPFLIAVFCVLLFGAVNLLTRDKRTVYDYLEDVKTGSLNKRWQGAFELSKLLAHSQKVPKSPRFVKEMTAAFKASEHDDPRIRQYLALAMGRTGHIEFVNPLLEEIGEAKDNILPSLIYALGQLQDPRATEALRGYVNHPQARVRSITMAALGNLQNPATIPDLKEGLKDEEPNVQWSAAVGLALMGDATGAPVLEDMLSEPYLDSFAEVDQEEKKNIMLTAIEAAGHIESPALRGTIESLAKDAVNLKVRAAAQKALNQSS